MRAMLPAAAATLLALACVAPARADEIVRAQICRFESVALCLGVENGAPAHYGDEACDADRAPVTLTLVKLAMHSGMAEIAMDGAPVEIAHFGAPDRDMFLDWSGGHFVVDQTFPEPGETRLSRMLDWRPGAPSLIAVWPGSCEHATMPVLEFEKRFGVE